MEEKRRSNNGGKWQFAFWVVTGGLIILGGAVAANDIRHNGENTDIRRELVEGDKASIEHSDSNQDELRTEVNIELKEIRKEQQVMRKEQSDMKVDILVAIKGLESKIENE